MHTINIAGIPKARLLAALFNNVRPVGLGFMHFNPRIMLEEEAQALLDSGYTKFDYLEGRVMKVDLSGEDVLFDLYDRDNGSGQAERIVSELRSSDTGLGPLSK